MYSLAVRNNKGYMLELTDNPDYIVSQVTGLTAAGNTINTSPVAGMDGERVNSSRINKRNIVITILPNDPVDENRIKLYRFFPEKGQIRLYYKNRLRDVYIDGVVETLEGDLFSMREQIQISVLCPEPYFVGNKSDSGKAFYSPIMPLLEFPYSAPDAGISMSEIVDEGFTIENEGTVATGGIFHISIPEMMHFFKIQNRQTGEYIGVDYPFQAYDNLYINTVKGEKGIYLIREGVRHNLVGGRIQGSSWLQVDSGTNDWIIESDRNTYYIDVEWKELYEGV